MAPILNPIPILKVWFKQAPRTPIKLKTKDFEGQTHTVEEMQQLAIIAKELRTQS